MSVSTPLPLTTRLPDGGVLITCANRGESEEDHAARHRDRWRLAAGWSAGRFGVTA